MRRALIILLAAEGTASRQISKTVGMHESHVAMWRKRFLPMASTLCAMPHGPVPGASTATTSG